MHDLNEKSNLLTKPNQNSFKFSVFKVVRAQYKLSFNQTKLLSVSYVYMEQFVGMFFGMLDDVRLYNNGSYCICTTILIK